MRYKKTLVLLVALLSIPFITSASASTPMISGGNSSYIWGIDIYDTMYYEINTTSTNANFTTILGFEVDMMSGNNGIDYIYLQERWYNNATMQIEDRTATTYLGYGFDSLSSPAYYEVYDPYELAPLALFYDVIPYLVYPCDQSSGHFLDSFFDLTIAGYDNLNLLNTGHGTQGSDYYANFTSPMGDTLDLLVNSNGVLIEAFIHLEDYMTPYMGSEDVDQHYKLITDSQQLITTDDHEYDLPPSNEGLIYKQVIDGSTVGFESFNVTKIDWNQTALQLAPNPTSIIWGNRSYWNFNTNTWENMAPPWRFEDKDIILGASNDYNIYPNMWFNHYENNTETFLDIGGIELDENEFVISGSILYEDDALSMYQFSINEGISEGNQTRIIGNRNFAGYNIIEVGLDEYFTAEAIENMQTGDDITIDQGGMSWISNIYFPTWTNATDIQKFYEPLFKNPTFPLPFGGEVTAEEGFGKKNCTFEDEMSDSFMYFEINYEGRLVNQTMYMEGMGYPPMSISYILLDDSEFQSELNAVVKGEWDVSVGDELIYEYVRANGTEYEGTFGKYTIYNVGYGWTEGAFGVPILMNTVSADYSQWIADTPNSRWNDTYDAYLNTMEDIIGRDIGGFPTFPSGDMGPTDLVYSNETVGSDLNTAFGSMVSQVFDLVDINYGDFYFNITGVGHGTGIDPCWYNITWNEDRVVTEIDAYLNFNMGDGAQIIDIRVLLSDYTDLPESQTTLSLNSLSCGYLALLNISLYSEDGFGELNISWGDGEYAEHITSFNENGVHYKNHEYASEGVFHAHVNVTDGQGFLQTEYIDIEISEYDDLEATWGVEKGDSFIYDADGDFRKYTIENITTDTYGSFEMEYINATRYSWDGDEWIHQSESYIGGFHKGRISGVDFPIVISTSVNDSVWKTYFDCLIYPILDEVHTLTYTNRILRIEGSISAEEVEFEMRWNENGVLVYQEETDDTGLDMWGLVNHSIIPSEDLEYTYGEDYNTIAFTVNYWENTNVTFVVKRNGTVVTSGNVPSNGIVGVYVDDLEIGEYIYEIEITDAFNQTITSTVVVTVVEYVPEDNGSDDEGEDDEDSEGLTTTQKIWIAVGSVAGSGGIGYAVWKSVKKPKIKSIKTPSKAYCKANPKDPRC